MVFVTFQIYHVYQCLRYERWQGSGRWTSHSQNSYYSNQPQCEKFRERYCNRLHYIAYKSQLIIIICIVLSWCWIWNSFLLTAVTLLFVFCCLVCADLIKGAKEKQLKVKGPVRMPTKVGSIYNQTANNTEKAAVLSFLSGCLLTVRVVFWQVINPPWLLFSSLKILALLSH